MMEAPPAKQTKPRQPNFSKQDCLLLIQIMGEPHRDLAPLTFHQVDKSRFSSKITSARKRESWGIVEERYNASATLQRDAEALEKKWDNLVTKHRAIYSDYKRELAMTGGGVTKVKYDLVTEAVMEVIGKDSASVEGIGPLGGLDTTYNMMINMPQSSPCPSTTTTSAIGPLQPVQLLDIDGMDSSIDNSSLFNRAITRMTCTCSCRTCSCPCHTEEDRVRLRYMKLKIRLMERELGEE